MKTKIKVISLLLCLTILIAGPAQVFAATGTLVKRVSHEETIISNGKEILPSKYLKNLKAPSEVTITPEYYKGVIVSFDYSFKCPSEIKQISRLHDFGDTPRYNIFTEALYSIDNKRTFGLIRSNHNTGTECILNNAQLVYFYDSMFDYFDADVQGTNEFKAATCMLKDEDGEDRFGFDETNHCLNLRIRYVILDTTTGNLYTSPYCNTVYYGKGYPKKIDKPVTSIPCVPEITEYARKFYYPYDSDIISPYYMISIKNSDLADEIALKNSGTLFIAIDMKKNGQWFRYTDLDYEYFCANEEIYMYLQSNYNDFSIEYDLDNIEIRTRYEFYEGHSSPYDYDNERKPFSTSEYFYATLKF